jgi:hypothetical protein
MFGFPVPGSWPGGTKPRSAEAGEKRPGRPGRPRYHWRTRMRRRLPWFLVNRGLVAKGRKDCRDHEWYKSTDDEDRCYHCEVGVRRPSGFPPSS